MKQKITPCLWFDTQAEEAANFYVSVFKNSRILQVTHYPEGMRRPAGMVMTVHFVLDGQECLALNGGPEVEFSWAVSLMVSCDSQEEIDYFWTKLSADGGEEVECGWVKDKYGLSWQIIPARQFALLDDANPAAVQRTMQAVLSMKKLDAAALQKAHAGE